MLPSFKETKILISEIMKQRGNLNRLSNTLNKWLGRHFDVFDKYNNTSLEFFESLLD